MYKHIKECWEAVEACKTIEQVEELIETFPKWSGEWDIQIERNSLYENCYVLYNTYWDDNLSEEFADAQTLDIEVEED